jgi:DNA modification methylase
MINIDLVLGDCSLVMKQLTPGSVDAIITDPPYPREYQQLYVDIAKNATILLKPGGSLLEILPHYNIPYIINETSKYLKWRWMNCMWQSGYNHPRMAMGIEVMWKPIGWWVKGSWPQGRGYIKDGFENNKSDKEFHEWQQHKDWSDYCMKFVKEDNTVLDPCMGAGTLALSCLDKKINFVGIENDPETYEVAKERIMRYADENNIQDYVIREFAFSNLGDSQNKEFNITVTQSE